MVNDVANRHGRQTIAQALHVNQPVCIGFAAENSHLLRMHRR